MERISKILKWLKQILAWLEQILAILGRLWRRYPKTCKVVICLAIMFGAYYYWAVKMPEMVVRRLYSSLNRSDTVSAYRCWAGHDGWDANSQSPEYQRFKDGYLPTSHIQIDSIVIADSRSIFIRVIPPDEVQAIVQITFEDKFWRQYLEKPENRVDALCAQISSPNDFAFVVADESGKAFQKVKRVAKIKFAITRFGLGWRLSASERIYIGVYSQPSGD